MPDPTKPTEEPKPTPTEPPPATPPPAEPPPADTQPAQPAPEATSDPLLDAIFKDLGDPVVPEVKKVEEEPPNKPDGGQKPDVKAEDKKPDEKPPETPPPAEPPKKKKKATILSVDPEIPPAGGQRTEVVGQKPEVKPEPAKPAEDPDAAYIAQLTEEQRSELEEAEAAERHFGDKYKGQRKKLLDWNRGFDERVTALKKENPERTLDENDTEFMKLLKTKPAINGFDQRKVIAAVAEERAFERLRKEQAPKIDEVEMRTRAVEIAPVVDKHMSEFKSGTLNFVVEQGEAAKDSLAAAAKMIAEGKEVPDELKLEATIVQAHLTAAETLAREYSLLVNKAKVFNKNDPNHVWIVDFIRTQGEVMASAPDEYRVRDGKPFIARDKYFALPEAEKAKHWTHSNRELMQLLGMSTYTGMKMALQAETEALEKKGLERRKAKPAANPPTPTPPPTPTTGASDTTADTGLKAQPTKMKGAATSAPASAQPGATPGGGIDLMVLFPGAT